MDANRFVQCLFGLVSWLLCTLLVTLTTALKYDAHLNEKQEHASKLNLLHRKHLAIDKFVNVVAEEADMFT